MNISIEDLLKNKNNNIIDIRDKYKYSNGHISNSINIPSEYLITNHSEYLDKDETYYLYCDNGYKSKLVSDELNYLGYKTINIIGGYNYYLLIK
ncbi:MAG: rhodanese-like domain-containing protein [Bacilli bacterium]|nr:rhodanese-like domain-containing protein [Bacilli bacterium]